MAPRAKRCGRRSPEQEAALKAARNFGGKDYAAAPIAPAGTRQHQHFGFMLVSCERADLRPQPDGVMIYDDAMAWLDPVPVPEIPRSEVIDELYGAIVDGKPPLHDGAWSLATMEVCLAILQSAREKKEIQLAHQIGVPRSNDHEPRETRPATTRRRSCGIGARRCRTTVSRIS